MARLCSSRPGAGSLIYLFHRRVFARRENAPVAQLDRVLPSEGRGFGFKSQRVHAIVSEVKAPHQSRHFQNGYGMVTILPETCPPRLHDALGRVKVNEPIKDQRDVNEGDEHHVEFFKA
jgi:hypothetical protein